MLVVYEYRYSRTVPCTPTSSILTMMRIIRVVIIISHIIWVPFDVLSEFNGLHVFLALASLILLDRSRLIENKVNNFLHCLATCSLLHQSCERIAEL